MYLFDHYRLRYVDAYFERATYSIGYVESRRGRSLEGPSESVQETGTIRPVQSTYRVR